MIKKDKLGYTIGDDFNFRQKGGGDTIKPKVRRKSSDIHI
jgi:hypothetical protein